MTDVHLDAAQRDGAAPSTRWLVSQAIVKAALDGVGDAGLLAVLATALADAGVELYAIEVACDVVNTERADRIIRWRRGSGRSDGVFSMTDVFRGMLRDGATERRVDVAPSEARSGWDGATDAMAFAGHLAPDVTVGFFDDVMTLFVTERPGGFADAEIGLLRDVMPVFALAIGARLNAAAARTLLETYLGEDAATALLGGRVRLGDVATVRAVVVYCDLLGFTSMTEKLDAASLIGHLNLFFETITRPMARAGGQVAGHVGDAVIVFFPIPDAPGDRPVGAAAIEGALAGLSALNALEESRPLRLAAPLRARIGIDAGDVVHGNIGSAGRFSFTIIGTPVNRAARLQALAKELGASVLMTADLARLAQVECRAFGQHVMRGFDEPVDVVGFGSAE